MNFTYSRMAGLMFCLTLLMGCGGEGETSQSVQADFKYDISLDGYEGVYGPQSGGELYFLEPTPQSRYAQPTFTHGFVKNSQSETTGAAIHLIIDTKDMTSRLVKAYKEELSEEIDLPIVVKAFEQRNGEWSEPTLTQAVAKLSFSRVDWKAAPTITILTGDFCEPTSTVTKGSEVMDIQFSLSAQTHLGQVNANGGIKVDRLTNIDQRNRSGFNICL